MKNLSKRVACLSIAFIDDFTRRKGVRYSTLGYESKKDDFFRYTSVKTRRYIDFHVQKQWDSDDISQFPDFFIYCDRLS